GFTLHVLMMNLWFVGLPAALAMFIVGGTSGRAWSRRFFQQLPTIVAFGINFGIVPLLFLQTAYYKAFYTGTVLMAWPWLMVLLWVMISYYSVYVAAFSAKGEPTPLKSQLIVFFGSLASLFFIIAGLTMSTGITFMASPQSWDAVWESTQVGGATLGTALPIHNYVVVYRILTMLGIAFVTTGVWAFFDGAWLGGAAGCCTDKSCAVNKPSCCWLRCFSTVMAIIGATVATYAYGKYLGLVSDPIIEAINSPGNAIVTSISKYVFCIPAGLLILICLVPSGCRKALALLAFVAQLGAVGVWATVRQWIQHLEIVPVMDAAKMTQSVQWSPIIAFLVLFVFGLLVCGWIVSRVVVGCKTAE
ncbi:MAG: hypothetical protein IJQ39_11375, partial [Thermoguttaceae bacterium]|nr:hypothetical protein [Thermoguttaceae bacterium]